ncbi:MAG TPA: carboxypeptidase-like regulatory domain-containing protein [Thermoplasmata archaeon]|nr:carboxypeptidase-like regulatory domain-containing protein [Thermoplasmata archaeon]
MPVLRSPRAHPRLGPALALWGARAGPALVALLLLTGLTVGLTAPSPSASSVSVVKLYQSSYVPEQGNFTVWMQLSDASNVQTTWFTFCQLSSPVCYRPVLMTAQGSGWFAGTTNRMSSYLGMTEGVLAGYNITIILNDNTTQYEPAIPNSFSNLSVAQSVTGEYMYTMTVNPTVYALSGVVSDASTGHPVAGATVTVSPGSNSTTTSATGSYTFPQLLNGSYSLSISALGYVTVVQAVSIAGGSVVKNVPISSAASPAGSTPAGGGLSTPYFGLSLWLWIVLVVALVAVAVVTIRLRRRGREGRPPEPSPPAQGEAGPASEP